MNLNTVIFEGNLTDTPQLINTTTAQTSVANAVVLVNRRAKDEQDRWVDAEPTRYQIKAFRSLADHIACLPKGATVLVVGTVSTDAWTDKTTGRKRTQDIVIVDAIGASLRFDSVQIESAPAGRESAPAGREGDN